MNISPQDVKKLRDATGAGFGDCKKALEAAAGDFELSKKKLKEMGIASADKRSDRDAKEGRIFIYADKNRAGILLMSCETDFVAINEHFVTFGNSLVKTIVENGQDKLTENQELEVKTLAATTKENVQVKELFNISVSENEFAQTYTHGEESRIGVLLKLKVEDSSKFGNEILLQLAKDLTLHIAAFAPDYLGNGDVSETYIKEQAEIFTKQLEASGKPKNIIEGIVTGKVKKHLAEICLLDQGFVKDDKLTVRQKLEEVSKLIGSKIEIAQFKYLAIG